MEQWTADSQCMTHMDPSSLSPLLSMGPSSLPLDTFLFFYRHIMKQDDTPPVLVFTHRPFPRRSNSTVIVLTLKQVLTPPLPSCFLCSALHCFALLCLVTFLNPRFYTRNRLFQSSISSSPPVWRLSRKCKFSPLFSAKCKVQRLRSRMRYLQTTNKQNGYKSCYPCEKTNKEKKKQLNQSLTYNPRYFCTTDT
jgi:hypothetical protein